jgi:hypothetical protein
MELTVSMVLMVLKENREIQGLKEKLVRKEK